MCKRTGRHIKSGLIALVVLLLCVTAVKPGQAQQATVSIETGILACEAPLTDTAASLIQSSESVSFAVLPASTPAGQLNQLRRKPMELLPCLPNFYSIPGFTAARERQLERDLAMLRQFNAALNEESEQISVKSVVMGMHPNLHNGQVAGYFKALARQIGASLEIPNAYLISNSGRNPADAEGDTSFRYIRDPGYARPAAQPDSYNQLPDSETAENLTSVKAYVVPYYKHDTLRRLHTFLSAVSETESAASPGQKRVRVLFRWEDYSHYQQNISGFTGLLEAYNISSEAPVALPAPEQPAPNPHYSALLLLLLWLSFGLHYFFSYSYRRAVKRYHLSHTFFVEDVLDRHVRFTVSSLLLLLQTGFMWGLAAYTAVPALLTEAGMQGLTWHYPIIEYNWTLMVIFFMMGTAFNLICVLWLSSSCPRTDGIVQAATLQMWPMHLGFLLITLLVPGVSAGLSASFIQIVLLCFFLLNIAAFIVAAVHFSRRPTLPLPLHWLATIVLYVGVLAGTSIYIIYGTVLSEVIQLALHI